MGIGALWVPRISSTVVTATERSRTVKALWVLGAAGFFLMADGYASDTPPIPRMSSVCPPGYARNGAYCVPVADCLVTINMTGR